MFGSKTVFIVGAGASLEVGLPTGYQLMEEIAKKLDFYFEDFGQMRRGDRNLNEAIKRIVADFDNTDEEYHLHIDAAKNISEAMPVSSSIDTFIDKHNENVRVEVCGKLAISTCILEAERRSKIYFDKTKTSEQINYAGLKDTWLDRFVKIVSEGCRVDNVNDIFKNVSFVNFNYDRCVEHFLYYALQTIYRIDETRAAGILNGLTIIHPYGTVGRLPWQRNEGVLEFGESTNNIGKLVESYRRIRTFTEGIQHESSLKNIENIIFDADIIVFLGFAFHEQNMELIDLKKRAQSIRKRKTVYGTAFGFSESDLGIVEHRLNMMFNNQIHSQLRKDKKCFQLFDEYQRSISV